MKFLSRLLLLGGYILVYAAVANQGRLAAMPWMGVFRDAYGVDSKASGGGAASTPTAPPATGRQRRPGVRVGTRTAPTTGAGGATGSIAPGIGPGTGGT